jgi:HprK-related kinase A
MSPLRSLSEGEARSRLGRGALRLRAGPYTFSLRSNNRRLFEGLFRLYADYPLEPEQGFADFRIAIVPANLLQKCRGKVDFYADGERPFNRIESHNAYAFMEWGMNWCISMEPNEYLKLHAAVVSRNNVGVIFPGVPGAGKSTLCAALCLSGWRVLSDEHALIPFNTPNLVPLCRPISLKNESIDIIENFGRGAILGPRSKKTHKGIVAHMKADLHEESHDRTHVPARLIVFPQYSPDSSVILRRKSKAEAFMFAGLNSFNYDMLSLTGFETMSALMDAVECYDLQYSNLEDALKAMNQLVDEVTPA